MAEPKLMVEINGEAGGLFSILAKVAERLESFQQSSTNSADAARKSMGALEQGAKAAAQALKLAEDELAAIKGKLALGGGSGPDPAAAIARLQQAQAAHARITAQQATAEQALGQERVMAYLRATQATEGATRAVQAHGQAVQRAGQAHQGMTGDVFRAGAALMALRAALEGARQALGDVLENNLALERSQRTLQMATGDGASALSFVRKMVKDLGLELVVTADGYAMMAAAAKGTSMEGRGTEEVFRAVTRASSALSLGGEQTRGMIVALSQMMSKGKVQAEELRGQLGERLPGAFNIAARAMGVTTAQLDDMLKKGEIVTDVFIPRFARELELTLGDAPEKAAQSLQANINRIKTAFQGLSYELGQGGGGDSLSRALADIAKAMDSPEGMAAARELSRDLGEVVTAAKEAALILWKVRDPLVSLGLAWAAIKALQVAQGIYEWGAAKAAFIQQTLASRQAIIQETLAAQGLTLVKGQDAQAELAKAAAMLASRKATLENAVATGSLSLASATATREAIALAEAEVAKAAAMAASSRAAGLGAGAMAAMGGPIGVIIAAVGGLVFALSQMEDASKKVAQAESERLAIAARSRSEFQGLVGDAQRLNEILQSASSSSDQKTRAQRQLQAVIKQMLQIYPDFINFLQKEGDLYIWSTEALQKENERKLESVKADEQSAIAALKAAEAKVAAAWAVAKAENEAGASVKSWFARRDAKAEEENYKRLKDNYMMALKARQELEAAMEKLLNPDKPKGSKPADHAATDLSGIITPDEIQARLDALRLAHVEEVTLVQKRDAALLRAEKEYDAEAARIKKEAASTKFDGNQEGVEALWQANFDRRKRAEAKAEREYNTEREKLAADLQAKLTAQEEGGLEKRLEAVRKNFVAIRAENAKLAVDGKSVATEAEIQAAEDAAKARAREEQIRADMVKLKHELAELSQIKGGPLTSGEMAEAMERFAKTSETASIAVSRVTNQMHLNSTAGKGWTAGLKQYLAEGENAFEDWKNRALTVLKGVQNAFANGIQGILSGQMTLSQGMKAIWKGIVGTVIQAVSDLIAKWIVLAVVRKALGLEEAATDGGRTAAALATATAETWAAYAGIPYIGPALALAQISTMYASMGASIAAAQGMGASVTATARKTGGIAGLNGPELTVLGDGDELEVVAPKSSFMDFASTLLSMGANIAAADARTRGYNRQASSYARATREILNAGSDDGGAFAHPRSRGEHYDFRGAMFLGSDAETKRMFDKAVRESSLRDAKRIG